MNDTIIYGGREWAVEVGRQTPDRRDPLREWQKKPRVRIFTEETFDAIATASHPQPVDADGEIVYGLRGEDPAVDKAWDRHNRALVDGWRCAVEAVGLPVTGLKFSRRAGCDCPCSPGFIGEGEPGVTWRVTIRPVEA